MCVKKIEAFTDSKGGIHVREDAAILAEIGILTGFKPGDAAAIRNTAASLIPLLQRFVQIDAPVNSEDKAEPETFEKDPEPVVSILQPATNAELDAAGHSSSCRARASGDLADCLCAAGGAWIPSNLPADHHSKRRW